MESHKDAPDPANRVADEGDASEAALQIVEMLMLALIDKRIIDRDDLVAEVESLALAVEDCRTPPSGRTLKGRLSLLANSLSAAVVRGS